MTYRIYSKKGCIFCDAAMELLDKHSIAYEEIKIDENDKAKSFLRHNKFKTVPQIYDDRGKHIGGYQDLRNQMDWPDNPVEIHAF